jgi:hypothetical protein
MNNSTRLAIEAFLAIVLVVVGIMFFNQSNTLTETQDSLNNVQAQAETFAQNANATSTQSAVELADANAAAAQAAEDSAAQISELESAGTQAAEDAAQALDDANAAAAQVAEDSAAQISELESAGTQAAEDAAQALDDANAAAAQAAEDSVAQISELESAGTQAAEDAAQALDDVNATAVQAAEEANVASTQAANDIAGLNEIITQLNETIASLNTDLESMTFLSATQAADLSSANATIEIQTTQIADLQASQNAESSSSNRGSLGGLMGAGTSQSGSNFATDNYEIALPEGFIAFDLTDDRNAVTDQIRSRGALYESIADLAEQDIFIAIGFPEEFSLANFQIVAVMQIPITANYTYDDLLKDNAFASFESMIKNTEVIRLDEREVLRIDMEVTGVFEVIYVYLFADKEVAYAVMFTAFEALYHDNLANYEASAATFRLR